ncbi:MAG: hypothetical protein Q9222_005713 [Ikaeria aurantiellina]
MKGGSFNRIIGIEPVREVNEEAARYVLRIPRFEDAQQQRETAIIRYVQKNTSIPTTTIAFSDATADNPLKDPYVIHTRIPGQRLHDVYTGLSYEQKLSVIEQWALLLQALLAVRNDFAGTVDATTSSDGAYIFSINPFDVDPEPESERQEYRSIRTETTLDMLVKQFKRWDAADVRRYPNEPHLDTLDLLADVARRMDKAGIFEDTFFSLCHLDLYPRNVLVDIMPDGSVTLSGVLDWDSAVFAPNFLACAPPSWMWAWEEDDDEDEAKANETPGTTEKQGLKRAFEDAVGENFLKFCYSTQFRSARKLFNLALHGLMSNEAYREANSLCEEWGASGSPVSRSASPFSEISSAGQVSWDNIDDNDSLGFEELAMSECVPTEDISSKLAVIP